MFRRLVHDESAIALVLAVISVFVLTSLSAAALYSTTSTQRNSLNETNGNQAFALAEDGLAYAEARLYIAVDPANNSDIPSTTFSQDSGTVTYSGTISPNPCNVAVESCTWTLVGTGTVDGTTRSVSAQSVVPQSVVSTSTSTSTSTSAVTTTGTITTTSTQTINDSGIWNYIYIGTVNGCLQGNITINVPFYTPNNLCMSGHASYTGADLEVGGSLSMGGAASIGSSKQPISKLDVGGACTPAPCNGNSSPIWVSPPGVGSHVTPISMPTVNWNSVLASIPSVGSGGSNCPASFFYTGSTTPSVSPSTDVNLFPSTPYSCTIGSNTLSWDGSSNLTVSGTWYFDGSLSYTGGTKVVYSGTGTLYFLGTVNFGGNFQLCGISKCTDLWNTSKNALVLAAGCWANSTGSSLVTTGCVNLAGTVTLQAGTYAQTDYEAAGNVTNMGPVVASTGDVVGDVGQLLPLQTLPPGTPYTNTITTQGTTTETTTSSATTTMTTTTASTTPQPAQSATNFDG